MERELTRQGVNFRKEDHAFVSVADPVRLQAVADRLSPERIRKQLDYWTLITGPKFSKAEQKAMNRRRAYSAYWKNSFLKQYEKLSPYLRNEICCNNLANFRIKKRLDNLPFIRQRFLEITDRFAGFQAQCLNVHVDFPLLQRIALPIKHGSAKVPGIKIHDTRMIRLMEVLLHAGTRISGWSTKQIHQAILATFHLTAKQYGLAQLRYDLQKLKAHGLIERDGRRYAYRLTDKRVQVALLFLFFHIQLCGPLANSRFHHKPDGKHMPDSNIEAAYYKADAAIQQVIDLLAAA